MPGPSPAQTEPVLAGIARVDITPPLGISMAGYFHFRAAEKVHDPLSCTCLLLQDASGARLALCSLDLLGISPEDGAELQQAVARGAGLAPERCLVHCTHIHTGPSTTDILGAEKSQAYVAQLAGLVEQAGRDAAANLAPVELRAARVQVPGLAFNRRYWTTAGQVVTNPAAGSPNIVRPAGSVDEELLALFGLVDGRPRFALLNFACHADTLGGSQLSAGYPGYVRRSFEAVFPKCPVAFFNGFCGDINHLDFANRLKWHSGFEVAEMLGKGLASAAFRALRRAEPVRFVAPQVLQEAVQVPVRQPGDQLLQTAQKALCKPGTWEVDEARFEQASQTGLQEAVYLREALGLRGAAPTCAVPTWCAAAKDVAFCGLGGEIFVDYQLRLKQHSPLPYTFCFELANGSCGYIPTPEAFLEGGYEIHLARSSHLSRTAGEMLYNELLARLHRLQREV